MERSTLIQIKICGVDYTIATNRILTKQELVMFHQHLITAEQEQLNILKSRDCSPWDFDDSEFVFDRAAAQMQDSGITMTRVGVPAYINLDEAPDVSNTEGWDCDRCKHKDKSHREFPCCQCLRPAGRMFVSAEKGD